MHEYELWVYYEDTDLAGIVYYANYLKFIERARSEWVRYLGLDQMALKNNQDTVFAVRHLVADYIAPAKFEDRLLVRTSLETATPARLVLKQSVFCDERPIFKALVTLVALTSGGKPTRLPAEIRRLAQ